MDSEVTRELTQTTDGVTVRVERSYPHRPADVWSAWTEPERLRRWFGEVGGELRVGGVVWLWSEDPAAGGRVTVDRCDPPELLQLTSVEDGGPVNTIELRLSADSGARGTRLQLVHRGGSDFPGLAYGPGWEMYLAAAAEHLATGAGDHTDPKWADFEATVRPQWAALARHDSAGDDPAG